MIDLEDPETGKRPSTVVLWGVLLFLGAIVMSILLGIY